MDELLAMVRAWMQEHEFDHQGPTYDESDLFELVGDAFLRGYEAGKCVGRADAEREHIVSTRDAIASAKERKKWASLRKTDPPCKRSSPPSPSSPPRSGGPAAAPST